MIACHCHAVSDRTVMDAVATGATSIEAIGDACDAGSRCGGCHPVLDTLLSAARAVEDAFGPLHSSGHAPMREAAVG